MSSQKLTPELLEAMQDDLLRSMAEDVDAPVEVTADDLVSVKMDARFLVTQVKVAREALVEHDEARLEQAILSCVNDAIHGVARRNGEKLAESIRRLSHTAGA